MKQVLSSYDVLGGPHSIVSLYNTTKWKNANPQLYKVVLDAYAEAFALIDADIGRAAKIYVDFTKSKLSVDEVKAMISSKAEMDYGMTPQRTMDFARFMHKDGTIKNLPASWKDYFHDNAHGLAGS
jgi:NitT/TauT family transport system substrate-binding protein